MFNLQMYPSRRETRRQIRISRPPNALIPPQHQFEAASIQEETMIDPIFRVRLPIQPRLLHIDSLILRIEINVLHRRDFTRLPIRDADLFEERWCDEIDVLARVREQAHDAQRREAAHGAAVVVAGNANESGVELAGDVAVGAAGGEAWAAGVVVEEDGEKGLFVAEVE